MSRYSTKGLAHLFLPIFVMVLLLTPVAAHGAASTDTVHIDATNGSWTDTGITLQRGDIIRITAIGQMSYPHPSGCGPDGECINNVTILRGVLGSANGSIPISSTPESAHILIGSSFLHTNLEGQLYLGIGDSQHGDNSGGFEATVTHWQKQDVVPHDDAFSFVQSVGIGVTSSSEYVGPDRSRTDGTSLERVKVESIAGIIAFKRDCQCEVTITGGTEDGHATNLNYTHGGGWKLDTSTNAGIDQFILNRSDYVGTGGRYPIYRDRVTGYYYRDERSSGEPHWDIQFNTNAPSDLRP